MFPMYFYMRNLKTWDPELHWFSFFTIPRNNIRVRKYTFLSLAELISMFESPDRDDEAYHDLLTNLSNDFRLISSEKREVFYSVV